MSKDPIGIPHQIAGRMISPAQAEDYRRSGDWEYSKVLIENASQAAVAFRERLLPDVGLAGGSSRIESLFGAIRALVLESEHLDIRDDHHLDRRDHVLQMRIGPGSVVKIGATAKDLVPKAIGFAFLFISTAPVGTVFYGTVALSAYELMRVLRSCFVRIEDPDDKLVFEAIAVLSSRMVITDQEAWNREDFIAAYGKQAPTVNDLETFLQGKADKRVIEKSLVAMKERNLLSDSEGRWRIAF